MKPETFEQIIYELAALRLSNQALIQAVNVSLPGGHKIKHPTEEEIGREIEKLKRELG